MDETTEAMQKQVSPSRVHGGCVRDLSGDYRFLLWSMHSDCIEFIAVICEMKCDLELEIGKRFVMHLSQTYLLSQFWTNMQESPLIENVDKNAYIKKKWMNDKWIQYVRWNYVKMYNTRKTAWKMFLLGRLAYIFACSMCSCVYFFTSLYWNIFNTLKN